ncbi:MAG TPA: hypothetical protein VGF79_06885 [Bacteroidia bacterium]
MFRFNYFFALIGLLFFTQTTYAQSATTYEVTLKSGTVFLAGIESIIPDSIVCLQRNGEVKCFPYKDILSIEKTIASTNSSQVTIFKRKQFDYLSYNDSVYFFSYRFKLSEIQNEPYFAPDFCFSIALTKFYTKNTSLGFSLGLNPIPEKFFIFMPISVECRVHPFGTQSKLKYFNEFSLGYAPNIESIEAVKDGGFQGACRLGFAFKIGKQSFCALSLGLRYQRGDNSGESRIPGYRYGIYNFLGPELKVDFRN